MSNNEIICPHCGEIFSIDEAKYDSIVQQVRDKELKKEREIFEQSKQEAIAAAESKVQVKLEKKIVELQAEIQRVQDQKQQLEKENKLKLEAKLKTTESNYKEQLAQQQASIDKLENDLEAKDKEQKLALADKEKSLTQQINDQKLRIAELENKLQSKDDNQNNLLRSQKLELDNEYGKEINKLQNDISNLEKRITETQAQSEQEKHNLELGYKNQIDTLKDENKFLKDLKLKLSTKMVGETLERHCETQFNDIRPYAFPKAYFGKDNDSSEGTKGDYIFRESEDGIEFISIMFEMKNEMDTTATKKRNTDFLAKLDKDRKTKNCEYAVLVTLLEQDNEVYNNGIFTVPEYEKMYIIRPQFFISLIGFLRNANRKSLSYLKELDELRQENIDVTNFKDKLEALKKDSSTYYEKSTELFNSSIKSIDEAIAKLKKTRNELASANQQLRLGTNKINDFTISKAIRGNETMKKKFAEVGYDKKEEQEFSQYKKVGLPPLPVVEGDDLEVIDIDEDLNEE